MIIRICITQLCFHCSVRWIVRCFWIGSRTSYPARMVNICCFTYLQSLENQHIHSIFFYNYSVTLHSCPSWSELIGKNKRINDVNLKLHQKRRRSNQSHQVICWTLLSLKSEFESDLFDCDQNRGFLSFW